MTDVVSIQERRKVSRRRDGGVARARPYRRTDETMVSHARDTGSSYKKSNNISHKQSPINIYTEGQPYLETGETIREREVETSTLCRARQRSAERFIKGPISVRLIAAAGKLPGRALLVLLAIHHRVAITGKPKVSLPANVLTEFGFDKHAKARGLHELERAGLIGVQRGKGRAALISLSQRRSARGSA